MPTHLYCLLTPPRADAVPSGLLGVDGIPVRTLVSGAVEAWVSDAPPRVVSMGPGAQQHIVTQVIAHNAVLDAALATDRTPIPARFGQRFDDDAALLRDIERQRARVLELLGHFAGSVEMGAIVAPTLRRTLAGLQPVTPRMIDTAERGAGLRYLEKVRERHAATERTRADREQMAKRVSDVVSPLVRAEHRSEQEPRAAAGATLTLAHLVDRTRIGAYREAVASIVPDAGWRLIVTGPRAPYSFCAAQGGDSTGMILAG